MKSSDFLISDTETILDALKKIDENSSLISKILFVKNEKEEIIGSISDGDCRRSLIKGIKLDSKVREIMNKNFTFLRKGKYDIPTIQRIRSLNFKYVPELNDNNTLSTIRDFTDGKSYIPVDAVLMAGGKGERLRPLTLETPKPLLKVADKPIIDYNIENLMQYGVDNINVTVNYLGEQLEWTADKMHS